MASQGHGEPTTFGGFNPPLFYSAAFNYNGTFHDPSSLAASPYFVISHGGEVGSSRICKFTSNVEMGVY